ncbi:ATP-binding cassette domain-containing protein [Mesorhizobium sp. M00.F.Ca.ET.149.01.1.1]|nr:ATP-binding cassette domain-containing protein [Mesorhizobium sp. M8A.F.Ca.ET.197.01.1.1]TGR37105.1 ATP-binding cassette domain-containing protein [bacterium M00.F.Ca.ET.199.01.1.1]TGR41611.1 ATP-binding cassette domain-containing protein [Mesorhizobium sp. M8A.F.Ca.ET.198.01.1.1]TGV85343.1 ATP-binding cassette domain-containing protein [Mesorhizobium sp. M00.F.Ca.ET.149.01.1.1]
MTVKTGSTLALFGHNGGGRSTLISIITGMVKSEAGQCVAA